MFPLFVSNNLAVEGFPLRALLQHVLLSKASFWEVEVLLDGRVSKWWLCVVWTIGDFQVGCVVIRGRPIEATREGHVFQLFPENGLVRPIIAHPYMGVCLCSKSLFLRGEFNLFLCCQDKYI